MGRGKDRYRSVRRALRRAIEKADRTRMKGVAREAFLATTRRRACRGIDW